MEICSPMQLVMTAITPEDRANCGHKVFEDTEGIRRVLPVVSPAQKYFVGEVTHLGPDQQYQIYDYVSGVTVTRPPGSLTLLPHVADIPSVAFVLRSEPQTT